MQTISMTVAASHPSTKRQRFSFYLRSNQSQTKTARSSTESEIIALDTAHRIGLHERYLLEELGFPHDPTVLAINNTAAITWLVGASVTCLRI
jgi:hypothetical protein